MNIQFLSHFKIGIIGTKSVGKTTIANLLVGYLSSIGIDVHFIEEVAKKCPLPLNEDTTLETCLWILGNQISNESMIAEDKVIVCDRTVIDIYPFARLAKSIHREELTQLKKLIMSYISLRPYNVLFYISPSDDYFSAEIYLAERNFQMEIDREFRNLLKTLSLKVVEINQKDSAEGLKEIVNYLERNNNITS